MPQSAFVATHCINPDCPRPYPQTWGHNFCQSCGASLRLLNRYVPLERLGIGGFAAIYTVWDLHTQTEQVLKVLQETSPKALELFEQEAWVLANLRHPGIPQVEPDGYFMVEVRSTGRRLPCLVMEKIQGRTLQEILDDYPHGCPEAWVLNWFAQTAEILQALHQRQIIHRDLKPSNLMLREQTYQLVMIDFGGAKQVGHDFDRRLSPSSTRLVSPGYSPPEQISGGGVGPSADFYALGRTCIHLLTGKYPADLEDPLTGQLRWRHIAPVSPAFANLLDDMVQLDIRQRPASALEIQERLHTTLYTPTAPNWLEVVGNTALTVTQDSLSALVRGGVNLTVFTLGAITQTVCACLDTGWEMLLGGIGGSAGAVGGLVLAYWSPVGLRFASGMNLVLKELVPEITFQVGPELLVFALAGAATAVGLTDANGFHQRQQYLLAGLTGLFGYLLGGVCWSAAVTYGATEGIAFGAIAIASLTLGMGLRSHHLIHALMAALGTAGVFTGVKLLNLLPETFFSSLSWSDSHLSWPEFWGSIAFFGSLGGTIALCLGVSHYLIVPVLRWLGWR